MSTRPEILFPLFADLTTLPGVGPKVAQSFEGLGVSRPRDLLLTLPYGLTDRRLVDTVQGVPTGQTLSVQGTVVKHSRGRTATAPYRVQIEDAATTFDLVFFRAREEYLHRQLPVGTQRIVSGKVEIF